MTIKNLDISMRPKEMVLALAEGNPGALRVLSEVVAYGGTIDPDNMLGAISVFGQLDDLDIRGSHIWMLYKDVCGQKIDRFLAVLRAHQLGFLTTHALKVAIGTDETRGDNSVLNVDDLIAQVKAELPDFKIEVAS